MKLFVILLADLLTRMIGLNSNLHTYSATMHAHVALESFPFLSTDIVATYYHKDPDLNKIAVTSGLPAIAQGFSQLFPQIEPPARWDAIYAVTQTGDDGRTTTFTLVPRAAGNVSKITVTVDDATATIRPSAGITLTAAGRPWTTVQRDTRECAGHVADGPCRRAQL